MSDQLLTRTVAAPATVDELAAGGADTTTTSSYDGNAAGQPHTLTSTTTTGAVTASTAYRYDPAGNMTHYDEKGNQVYRWSQPGGRNQITIRDPGNGNIVTNRWSSDR